MNLIQKFNNLNGLVVNRTTLEYLLKRAEKERNSLIQSRIIKVLNEFKDDKFLIEIVSLIEPYGLNGVELEYFENDDLNEPFEETGLNGIPQQEIYDLVTNQLIENLENSKRWDDGQNNTDGSHIIALNFQTKKPYRGINQLLLGGNPMLGTTLENPYYLTFKQVEKLGGKVNTGAKSKDAIFYTILYNYKGFKTSDKQKFIDHLLSTGIPQKEIKALVFSCGYGILRIYNVFNGKDITGIDFKLPPVIQPEEIVIDKIEICESILNKYPAPKPAYKFGGKQPYYSFDYVQMPKPEVYKDIRTFYAVFFHELIHSTGHHNRLNRTFGKRFGDKNYALEELVAEIGASFLCANTGIFYFTKENSKSYINGWRKGVVEFLKTDNKGIFVASAKAQKAVDFLLTNITEKDYEVSEKIIIKPVVKAKKRTKSKVWLNGIEVSSEAFKKMNVSELKKFTLDFYNKNLKGKKTEIENHLKEVVFVANAGRKILQPIYSEKVAILDKLEYLIKNSTYNNFGAKKETDTKDVLGYLNFKSKVTIDGVKRHVRISIVLDKNRNTRFKSYEVGKIKKSDNSHEVVKTNPKDGEKKSLSVNKVSKNNTNKDENLEKGLNAVLENQKIIPIKTNSLAHRMANRKTDFEYFEISNSEISEFLGQIEIKEKESIVISLTGGQGSMKTRFAFQFMNALAQNYKVGHASIEEHPDSKLYFDKVDQYLNEKALNNIEAPEIKNVSDLDKLIKNNDVIVIDSYAKMQEIEKGFEVDKDLRKKYDGKLFLVIFQQTTDGKMRGGSKSQFDADIVLFTEKKEDYKNNYVYADKNRYQSKSLDSLHFNIFSGKLLPTSNDLTDKEIKSSTEVATNVFSFNIN